MKRKSRMLLTALMTLILILVGCGGGEEEVTPVQGGAEKTTTEAAVEDDMIVIGYASMGDVNPFHSLVTDGFEKATADRGMKLVAVDNNWDSQTTVKNVEELISQDVDVIICGLSDSAIAAVLIENCETAGIPLIFIDNNQPGIPILGGNNVTAGGLGGEWLGKTAMEKWGGADLFIGLEFPSIGELNDLRMKQGFLDHTLEYVDIPEDKIYRVDSKIDISESMKQVNDIINANPGAERILIDGITDDCAQGALAAVEQLGYEDKVLICGQGFYDEVSAQNFQTEEPTAWGATVAYWPTKYADTVLPHIEAYFADGTALPEEMYVEHIVITRDNVEEALAQQ